MLKGLKRAPEGPDKWRQTVGELEPKLEEIRHRIEANTRAQSEAVANAVRDKEARNTLERLKVEDGALWQELDRVEQELGRAKTELAAIEERDRGAARREAVGVLRTALADRLTVAREVEAQFRTIAANIRQMHELAEQARQARALLTGAPLAVADPLVDKDVVMRLAQYAASLTGMDHFPAGEGKLTSFADAEAGAHRVYAVNSEAA
jgi:hypothetical protein